MEHFSSLFYRVACAHLRVQAQNWTTAGEEQATVASWHKQEMKSERRCSSCVEALRLQCWVVVELQRNLFMLVAIVTFSQLVVHIFSSKLIFQVTSPSKTVLVTPENRDQQQRLLTSSAYPQQLRSVSLSWSQMSFSDSSTPVRFVLQSVPKWIKVDWYHLG